MSCSDRDVSRSYADRVGEERRQAGVRLSHQGGKGLCPSSDPESRTLRKVWVNMILIKAAEVKTRIKTYITVSLIKVAWPDVFDFL